MRSPWIKADPMAQEPFWPAHVPPTLPSDRVRLSLPPQASMATVRPAPAAHPETCGRFTVVSLLARGGMGEVVLAHDAELNRDVALKRLQEAHQDDVLARRRFLREAVITAQLEHPGIVPVYGLVWDHRNRPRYAMRVIQGQSLADAILEFHNLRDAPAAQRALAFRQLLQRFVNVCQTVAYAHSKGVIHRDLKPGNVMLGDYGETLVVDWGLARRLTGGPDSGVKSLPDTDLGTTPDPGAHMTLHGQALGTPHFMPPEQAAGQWERVGPAADVYSLGATLFALLTGRPPFEGPDVVALLERVKSGGVPSPRHFNPNVPRALEAVCLRALAHKPEDRYRSALELAQDLERWLADAPVSAYKAPVAVRARQWLRRNKAARLASVFLLGAAALMALALAWQNDQARRVAEAGHVQSEAAHAQAQEAIRQELNAGQKAQALLTAFLAEDSLPRLKDLPASPTRQRLVEELADHYRRLVQAPGPAADRAAQARAWATLGELETLQGRGREAEAAFRQAVRRYEELHREGPAGGETPQNLIRCLRRQAAALRELGQARDAEPLIRLADQLEAARTKG
jgi:tRNA A-37 threonylcarbamoyl transferase component Bud32/tetratricopeptide (TPR) repeat protein